MRLSVEVGRFFATALAVAFMIPTGIAGLSFASGERFSFEAFFALGAIGFVMAIIGGLTIGLPTLWLARRVSFDRDVRKQTALACVAGGVGGVILSAAFWQGDIEIVMAGALIWAAMGAAAGVTASLVWFWLHLPDRQDRHHD